MKKLNIVLSLLKGILLAVIITIIGIGALALFVKDTEGSFVSAISLVIKILSIVAGTILSSVKIRKKGAVTGVATAGAYWIICLLLTLITEPFDFSLKLAVDLLFNVLIGAFAGILTVNALK